MFIAATSDFYSQDRMRSPALGKAPHFFQVADGYRTPEAQNDCVLLSQFKNIDMIPFTTNCYFSGTQRPIDNSKLERKSSEDDGNNIQIVEVPDELPSAESLIEAISDTLYIENKLKNQIEFLSREIHDLIKAQLHLGKPLSGNDVRQHINERILLIQEAAGLELIKLQEKHSEQKEVLELIESRRNEMLNRTTNAFKKCLARFFTNRLDSPARVSLDSR
jgi:hypothetical protein